MNSNASNASCPSELSVTAPESLPTDSKLLPTDPEPPVIDHPNTPYTKEQISGRKLLCRLMTAHKYCNRGPDCAYAHTLREQELEPGRLIAIRMMLDCSLACPEDQIDLVYHEALSMCRLCDSCVKKECTGGYNCYNGACHRDLLVCCDDIFAGSCENELYQDSLPKVASRFFQEDIQPRMRCISGYHLTSDTLLPYNDYVRLKCNQYDCNRVLQQCDPFQQREAIDYDQFLDFRELDLALAEYLCATVGKTARVAQAAKAGK